MAGSLDDHEAYCSSMYFSKNKMITSIFLKENAGICSDHWSATMLPAILICFVASEQKPWTVEGTWETTAFVCHWLQYAVMLLTEVAGRGPFVVSKPSLSPLITMQILNRSAELQPDAEDGPSHLCSGTEQSESDPSNACSPWNLNM